MVLLRDYNSPSYNPATLYMEPFVWSFSCNSFAFNRVPFTGSGAPVVFSS